MHQTICHIVKRCSHIYFDGGLDKLHKTEVNENEVKWIEDLKLKLLADTSINYQVYPIAIYKLLAIIIVIVLVLIVIIL